jgi:hypothetical protein
MLQSGRNHGERVAGVRLATIGSLGGGSGSGGGPTKVFKAPDPGPYLGVDASIVYGGNFQLAMPINLQLAFGSNLQICINPFGFKAATDDVNMSGGVSLPADPVAAGLLGSGIGGNMQLTLGTSANFVVGQSYDINLGPRKIALDGGNKINPSSIVTCQQMIAATGVFFAAYLIPSDDVRMQLLIGYQLTMQLLLIALMNMRKIFFEAVDETTKEKVYDKLFGTYPHVIGESHGKLVEFAPGITTAFLTAAGLSAMFLPPVLEGIGEAYLDSSNNDSNNNCNNGGNSNSGGNSGNSSGNSSGK